MAEKTNPHINHRKRLRRRFLNEGIDNFEDHNVLELLLFYSIPRKDTNELAHRLISTFGSHPKSYQITLVVFKRKWNVCVIGICNNSSTFTGNCRKIRIRFIYLLH